MGYTPHLATVGRDLLSIYIKRRRTALPVLAECSRNSWLMQDKVVGYTSHLATVGRDLLAEELGLDRLDIPPAMEAPNLRMLKLPGVPQSFSGIKDKRVRS